jgi:hypothetical protein
MTLNRALKTGGEISKGLLTFCITGFLEEDEK